MEPIVSLLSAPEKAAIYGALGLSTAAVLFLALYVRVKFSRANGTLHSLTKQWSDAEKSFFEIADVARESIRQIERPAPANPGNGALQPRRNDFNGDTRDQIVAMGRRGMTAAEIAATAGLGEAEVEVLLGMHRIGHGKN